MAITSSSTGTYTFSILLVFSAGVLWSTVGLGIRMIEDADVWQILLYRSIGMSIFLYFVILLRSKEGPVRQIKRTGFPCIAAGLSLVVAYSGGTTRPRLADVRFQYTIRATDLRMTLL